VLRLKPAGPAQADGPLELEAHALNGFDLGPLAEALAATAGLVVDWQPFVDPRWQRLGASGGLTAERLREVAEAVVPNLTDLAPAPRFAPGASGLMQVLVLACLSQRLRWAELSGPAGPGP
jgi:hypothetical protein